MIDKISREQADGFRMGPRSKFGVISKGCDSVWADGRTMHAALESAKKYFQLNKLDFLRDDKFNLRLILDDCKFVEVVS